jgi:hypothetical protein
VLAAVVTVAGLYLLGVPGAGFGLVVLCIWMYFSIMALDDVGEWLKERSHKKESQVVKGAKPEASRSALLPLSLGTLLGVVVSLIAVSTLLVPPTYLKQWVFHSDPLADRIERALNPAEQRPVTEPPKVELADASTGELAAALAVRASPSCRIVLPLSIIIGAQYHHCLGKSLITDWTTSRTFMPRPNIASP